MKASGGVIVRLWVEAVAAHSRSLLSLTFLTYFHTSIFSGEYLCVLLSTWRKRLFNRRRRDLTCSITHADIKSPNHLSPSINRFCSGVSVRLTFLAPDPFRVLLLSFVSLLEQVGPHHFHDVPSDFSPREHGTWAAEVHAVMAFDRHCRRRDRMA